MGVNLRSGKANMQTWSFVEIEFKPVNYLTNHFLNFCMSNFTVLVFLKSYSFQYLYKITIYCVIVS